jgi:hypothetical protein
MGKEDIKTIGSKGVVLSPDNLELDTESLTEEEKKKAVANIRKQARKMIRHTFLSQFKQIYKKYKNGQTIDEIIQEVRDKKSDMTKSARDFVTNFKKDVIEEWILDIESGEEKI